MDINRLNEEGAILEENLRSRTQNLNDFISRNEVLLQQFNIGNESYRTQTSLARQLANIDFQEIKNKESINKLKTKAAEIEESILRKVEKIKDLREKIKEGIDDGTLTDESVVALEKYIDRQKELLQLNKNLADRAQQVLEIYEKYQAIFYTLDKLSKNINKIPIIGPSIGPEIQRIITGIEKSIFNSMGATNMWVDALKGASRVLSGMVVLNLLHGIVKTNEEQTKFTRNLLVSTIEANKIREQYVQISNLSGDNLITTEKLVKANSEISKYLGFNKAFSSDIVTEFVNLTEKIDISKEAAAGLVRTSIVYGDKLKSIKTDIAEQLSSLNAQYGVNLNIRGILEQTGKASAIILSNFKNNPIELAKGLAQIKLMGTSLENITKQQDALLNFPTSIENQLEASLFLGRRFNLERAREYALTNDLVGVAKELNNQQIDFNSFSRMNAIQQQSVSKALGLSKNELADQLLLLEAQTKSRSQIASLSGAEAVKRLEALTAEQKFNNTLDKMKNVLNDIVSGPLGVLLDILTDSLSIVGKLVQKFQELTNNYVFKIVMGGLAGAGIGASFAGVGALPGAIVGALGGLASAAMGDNPTTEVNDSAIDSGGKILFNGQKQSISFDKDDKIVTGTNLFKNDTKSEPAIIDVSKIVKELNNLGNRIEKMANRPVIAYARPSEFVTPISILQNANIRKSI